MKSYSSRDINDKELPEDLSIANPPDILLLTIEAASNLVQYHPVVLRTWEESDLLHGVWIDEIQTLLDEYDFRTVYQQLPLYGTIGTPVTLMSGSFPRQMVSSVMKYLNLLPQNSIMATSIDEVHSEDIIGSGFYFEVVIVEDIIKETLEMIQQFQNKTGKSVHAVCASKVDCIEFGKRLSHDSKTAIAHGEMPKHEQTEVAKKWYNSQITKFFSTTIGMVGNENANMAGLYSIRLPYCLSNFIQIIGRFRPNQRRPPAIMRLVITTKDLQRDNWQSKQADERRTQLLNAGIINEQDLSEYNQEFHIDGLKDYLNQDGCYILRFQNIFSSTRHSTPCRNCTWCCTHSRFKIHKSNTNIPITLNNVQHLTNDNSMPMHRSLNGREIINPYKKTKMRHTPIEIAAAAAYETEQVNTNIRERGERILSWLKIHCPQCKISGCEGICNKSCIICGEIGHMMNNCKFNYRTDQGKELEIFLKNKRICNWCYGLIGNGEMHGVEKGQRTTESRCILKRRLKCAINIQRRKIKQNHGQHLREIFSSENSFYKYICTMDIDITSPTKSVE